MAWRKKAFGEHKSENDVQTADLRSFPHLNRILEQREREPKPPTIDGGRVATEQH